MNPAAANPSTVFFFDVDNTLLDNDRVAEDLKQYLVKKVGDSLRIEQGDFEGFNRWKSACTCCEPFMRGT